MRSEMRNVLDSANSEWNERRRKYYWLNIHYSTVMIMIVIQPIYIPGPWREKTVNDCVTFPYFLIQWQAWWLGGGGRRWRGGWPWPGVTPPLNHPVCQWPISSVADLIPVTPPLTQTLLPFDPPPPLSIQIGIVTLKWLSEKPAPEKWREGVRSPYSGKQMTYVMNMNEWIIIQMAHLCIHASNFPLRLWKWERETIYPSMSRHQSFSGDPMGRMTGMILSMKAIILKGEKEGHLEVALQYRKRKQKEGGEMRGSFLKKGSRLMRAMCVCIDENSDHIIIIVCVWVFPSEEALMGSLGPIDLSGTKQTPSCPVQWANLPSQCVIMPPCDGKWLEGKHTQSSIIIIMTQRRGRRSDWGVRRSSLEGPNEEEGEIYLTIDLAQMEGKFILRGLRKASLKKWQWGGNM